jgi:DNA invertase Pin-like site-specific DNA recombinase
MSDTSSLRMIGLTRKSKGEDEGTHVDQRARIERVCEREGFELLRVEQERGVSGAKQWREREIGHAIKDVAAGLADGIVVATEDRITRERLEAAIQIWNAMEEAGAVFVTDDGVDSRKDDAEFSFGLNALLARKQWKAIKTKSDMGRGRSVERGVHGGSDAPWGYEWTWIDDKHGPLTPAKDNRVAEAFEAIADGISHPAFKRAFGVKMSNVVKNRAYLGEAKSGTFIKADAHPRLVKEDVFLRANRRFEKADKGAGRPSAVKRAPALLPADVITCETCGHGLTRQPSPHGDYYRCQFATCPQTVSITCSRADEHVIAWVLATHERDAAIHLANPSRDVNLPAKEKALQAAQDDRAEIEADETLSPLRRAQALTAADAAVIAAEAALATAEMMSGWQRVPHARVIERIKDDADATRSLLREYVRVVVAPGRASVEERLTIRRRWRDDILAEAAA